MEEKEIPFAESNSENAAAVNATAERKDLFRKVPKWKRLWLKIVNWYLLTFRNKTLWKGEIGAFKFRVRKWWIDVRSIAPDYWNMRIGIGNTNTYGFILAIINEMQKATTKEEIEHLKNYLSFFAVNVYMTSDFIFQDPKFAKGLRKELEWATNRLLKKAAEAVKSTTKEQNDADEAFMQSAVERGQMNRQQRRKAQREERKAMKKAFKNDPIVRDLVHDKESAEE